MRDEKELKEMMMSEKADHDEEMEIEELKAEIERMIKGLNEISPEEKMIMEKIRKVLDEHELKYSYDEDEPKHIGLGFGMDNKPFKIHIILQNGKVILKLSFPFRVQSNAYPLMCMFMAEFNENKAFSLLNIDPDDGELTMEYSYMLENPTQFDEKSFWVYMTSLIHPALEIYTKVAHLAVGMVTGKERKLYKKLLLMAVKTINGDFDDDNVSYGIETIKADSLPDFADIFRKENEDEDKDKCDFDSSDYDVSSDILRNLMQRKRASLLEEFMQKKEEGDAGDDDESKKQTEKPVSMLSMFAKKKKDDDTKIFGGNEDEQENIS